MSHFVMRVVFVTIVRLLIFSFVFRKDRLPIVQLAMTGVTRKRARPATMTKSTSVKTKSRKVMLHKQTATPDKKITDFFPLRKSNRITAKVLEVCNILLNMIIYCLFL
jgi:hypothetical protein